MFLGYQVDILHRNFLRKKVLYTSHYELKYLYNFYKVLKILEFLCNNSEHLQGIYHLHEMWQHIYPFYLLRPYLELFYNYINEIYMLMFYYKDLRLGFGF